ncbi:Crp/Fnr family transcriptional regulator [Luteimonas sp. RD2P54]|uniref:CRP-like protein Clp n=1 Tax=Luteimonas endophytica TaxID=3042023 RepID=A0ABT6J8G2_9GAMM|nr:Crp/Fnr family transcriptional regulator [Luteimonas endophytica]MDH5823110.1 Crp/Fnr family transcriptional regulator [Luteimonas endophytica]
MSARSPLLDADAPSRPGGHHGRRQPHPGCEGCLTRSLAVCAALPAADTAEMEQAAGELRIQAGATLAREGAVRRDVYTVTRGMLRRVRLLPDGRRLVAGFLMAGDFIGFSGASHYRHTFEAVTDCALCVFSLQDMQQLCRSHPELEAGMLRQACAELDSTRSSLMTLARLTPVERLAGFLLDMAARQQRLGACADRVDLPMTRNDIADHLGLTIETVSRCFTRLKQDGMIEFDAPRLIALVQPAQLQTLAGSQAE